MKEEAPVPATKAGTSLHNLLRLARFNGQMHAAAMAVRSACFGLSTGDLDSDLDNWVQSLGTLVDIADEDCQLVFQLIMAAGEPIRPLDQLMADEDYVPSYWDEHRDYPLQSWVDEVTSHSTRSGYWLWVASQLLEREESDIGYAITA